MGSGFAVFARVSARAQGIARMHGRDAAEPSAIASGRGNYSRDPERRVGNRGTLPASLAPQRKRNPLPLEVDLENGHHDFLADPDDRARVFDEVIGELGDMH